MKKSIKGYTLVEIMISLALLAFILIIFYVLFNTNLNIRKSTDNKSIIETYCYIIEDKKVLRR